MEIPKRHILSGFEYSERADTMGAWYHLHGGSKCHGRNFFGKISSQSRGGYQEAQCKIRAEEKKTMLRS